MRSGGEGKFWEIWRWKIAESYGKWKDRNKEKVDVG